MVGGMIFLYFIGMVAAFLVYVPGIGEEDALKVAAGCFFWPLAFVWAMVLGIPRIFGYDPDNDRPVTLSRRQQRKVLLEDAINARLVKRNAIEREYKALTGTLPLE